ncbi:MAG: phosphotransferase family protein [Candidatus Hydrogenedentota bacterium]
MMHYLEQCVCRHRPDLAGAMTLTPIPTGKFNDSFYVDAGGEQLVLRIAPPDDAVFCFYERRMMRQEPGLHNLLHARTTAPVPRILAFDDSRDIIDRDFLLMKRMPGVPLTECAGADINAILREAGACLAQVHALTADAYGYLGEHAPMEPQPSWAEAFAVMWQLLAEDVAQQGYYTHTELNAMIDLFARHRHRFNRHVPASLLHMDIWAQNLLVEGGRLTGILDWDRALWGDPEIEFAVLDYCGVSLPPFWQGYGGTRDNSHDAQIRRQFYLLYEIQKYIVIRHGRNHNPAAACRYKEQVQQLTRAIPG